MNPAPEAPSSQHGRDAVLVHGLALLCLAVLLTLPFVVDISQRTAAAFLGVSVSAALALSLWSLVLSIRALWRGERARWPVLVIAVFLLEGALSCLAYSCGPLFFESSFARFAGCVSRQSALAVFESGAPVFVPTFVLAVLLAAPVAWWRTRRAEKRAMAQGGQPWGRARRWKRGAAWFFPVAALLAALLLPMPLFAFSAYTRYYARSGWRWWVIQHTPVFVGDAVARLAARLSDPRGTAFYFNVLGTGRVSRDRIMAEITSRKPYREYCALNALASADLPAALACAEAIGRGELKSGGAGLDVTAGDLLGQCGTPEQIRPVLDPARTPPVAASFLLGLWRAVERGKRKEFLPDLERFCQSAAPGNCRQAALEAFVTLASEEDIERLWASFLADTNAKRKAESVRCLFNPTFIAAAPRVPRPKVAAACLEDTDVSVRRLATWLLSNNFSAWRRMDKPTLRRMVKALVPMLDDTDRDEQLEAAWMLHLLTEAPQDERDFCEWINNQAGLNTEILAKVRAAAQKWLEENQEKPK
ncbi:MAG: hypothetical protein NTW87_17885 [Planctomycetota bacterium]|nr:hypothetical protein [Planctomycetota bacterium]